MLKTVNGALYVVATPIGNFDDMSPRAIAVLKGVDLIVAEDTRRTGLLLSALGIATRQQSLHAHNETDKADFLLQKLKEGASMALVSDAGTPLVSDPGSYFLAKAHEQGVKVVPIPGCCAAIAALSVAGMPAERFIFEGFLPTKSTARQERIRLLAKEPRTLILYEAPHRIVACLQDLVVVLGAERRAVIARELTKTYETIRKGALPDLLSWVMGDDDQQKGEFVVVIAGKEPEATADNAALSQILAVLLEELPLKQAVNLAAKITQEKKNTLYSLALDIQKNSL